jgi:hypothetical protein
MNVLDKLLISVIVLAITAYTYVFNTMKVLCGNTQTITYRNITWPK